MGDNLKNSPLYLKISGYLKAKRGTQGVSRDRASNLDARLHKGVTKTWSWLRFCGHNVVARAAPLVRSCQFAPLSEVPPGFWI